ncbi:T9SS type A sorting domain-containing protein [Robiginitalea sp. M366]|uniref:T9SS type A sorting domain-containing protein n=1 Tax=Robiginitalea aestuariiviva TaxID=3036903 RepID=UPI00240E5DD9|nr:T9SS type A sorting domain-containing protein [Robiginitalea aestuariiviva]MDG1571772.1 T9SS type A sorting domain-containing protein [Robiginitalea aestuariiviva]
MKQFYTLIFLFFLSSALAQRAPEKGDIDGFKLYPNPATEGKVYVITARKAPKKIRIYDVLGTPVLETTLLGNELNISDLEPGVYLIQVFEREKVTTRKLVVR